MFCFIILLLAAGGGFYLYQKIMAIEREIRTEQEIEKRNSVVVQQEEKTTTETHHSTIFDSESRSPSVTPDPEPVSVQPAVELTTLEKTILAEVSKQPGIKQTDIYPLVGDINKKQLQKLIKDMVDNGVLLRTKKGSSYALYPV